MLWKPVFCFDYLEASDTGLIRTLPRIIEAKVKGSYRDVKYSGKILTPVLQGAGYYKVTLLDPRPGHRQKAVLIHRLVCLAFHGEPPEGKPWVLHGNGVRADSRANNLYWGSPAESSKDMVRHGNSARGERSGITKITAEDVAFIRANYKGKSKEFGANAMAKKYGMHRTSLEKIVKGVSWI